jgi:hypothetical protein
LAVAQGFTVYTASMGRVLEQLIVAQSENFSPLMEPEDSIIDREFLD